MVRSGVDSETGDEADGPAPFHFSSKEADMIAEPATTAPEPAAGPVIASPSTPARRRRRVAWILVLVVDLSFITWGFMSVTLA